MGKTIVNADIIPVVQFGVGQEIAMMTVLKRCENGRVVVKFAAVPWLMARDAEAVQYLRCQVAEDGMLGGRIRAGMSYGHRPDYDVDAAHLVTECGAEIEGSYITPLPAIGLPEPLMNYWVLVRHGADYLMRVAAIPAAWISTPDLLYDVRKQIAEHGTPIPYEVYIAFFPQVGPMQYFDSSPSEISVQTMPKVAAC